MLKEQYETHHDRLVAVIRTALRYNMPHVLRARRKDLIALNNMNEEYADVHLTDDIFLLTIAIEDYRSTDYYKEIREKEKQQRQAKCPTFDPSFCKECNQCVQRGCVYLCYRYDRPRVVDPLTPITLCPFK